MTQAEGPVPPGAGSALHTLYRRWDGLKRGDRLPSCADIEAECYIAAEPGAALLAVERTGQRRCYRFRSVGKKHRVMGRNVVGFALEDLVPPRILSLVSGTYDRIVEDHTAHYWTRTLRPANGSAHAYERLIVPLAEDGLVVDWLLGVWNWFDEMSQAAGYSV